MSEFQLTKLLNLPDLEVVKYETPDVETAILEIQSTLGVAICPTCKTPSTTIHDYDDPRLVRDLSISGRKSYLRYHSRRFECAVCQQLSILQRKHDSPIQPNRVEKITLAVLTARLKCITHRSANQLRDIIRIFQPETILRWHRELVRRKRTYPHKNEGGRDHQSAKSMMNFSSALLMRIPVGDMAKSKVNSSS